MILSRPFSFEISRRSYYFDHLENLNRTTLSFFVNRAYKWTISLSLGLFLYLFMAVFLPFGISNYNPNHQYTLEFLLTLTYFMLGTSGMALLNEFFVKPFIVKTVRVQSILLWSAWLIIALGLTNFLIYNIIGEWHDWRFASGIDFTLNNAAVFLFPIIGTFAFFRYKALKFQYEQVLTNRDQSIDRKTLLQFEGQGTNEKISINLEDFLYAKAQDNYVELFYVANQSIQKELLRTTMNQVLEGLNSKWITRCHRSYMINLYNVRSIKGGNQIKLHLNHISQPIPVSNSFRESIMGVLKKVKSFG